MRSILNFSLAVASIFCFATQMAHAAPLQFQAGQTASYIFTQNYENNGLYFGPSHESEGLLFGTTQNWTSKGSLEFDITILSLNPETLSYPIEVEFTVRNICLETTAKGKLNNTLTYDSYIPISNENKHIAKIFQGLIDHNLKFIITDSHHVKETTGQLDKFINNLVRNTYDGIDVPLLDFEKLLSEIFHLAGEDLNTPENHPISSRYTLLGSYFADLFGIANEKDSGAYAIT